MAMNWSAKEKNISRQAFDLALQRENQALIAQVQSKSAQITEVDQVWALHAFLNARSRAMSQKYDYRYSRLLWVFHDLIEEQWLSIEDLEGLSTDKIDAIVKGY